MESINIDDNWYYVIVQNPDTSFEKLLGFIDEKTNEKFLPAFKTKQDAQKCFQLLPKDLFKEKYDIHAVIEDDLLSTAEKTEYQVFLLDETGQILKPLN
ncbi:MULTISPECIES: hypothetical protein [Desulfotignum]|jgi:hypothetical protein|uniref:Uncharacterized protein n=1 Tax=Desulfotignum phosphitoxidans DSM 13687 TaxID=1286635 RepID=S0G2L3_9BACT|nr:MULTISPECIES: hypothetical protein [Desulfotignum]EMS79679.1 hypothetical protein Dpo_4c02310 [Desulfotignum phosphitoxidans DSM 13687]